MDIVHDFDTDIQIILEACERLVFEYAPPMREQGHAYLEKLNLSRGKGVRSGGFSYLMPFWIKDAFGLDTETCRIIALGNVFGLLYFLSQDEVMDALPGEYKGNLLPLSCKFFLDFTAQYRLLFSSDSPFWGYFERYIDEWAKSILWERSEHWGRAKAYTEEDLILLSRKAAPLKIPFAAICILAEQEHLIQAFSDMMDYDQVVYQMIDDWRDWRDDMARGNFTYLLMQVMEYCNLGSSAELNEGHVKMAVYSGDVLEKIFELVKKYSSLAMESICTVDAPYLKAYMDLDGEQFKKIMEKVNEEAKRIMSGGLGTLLWKLTKKN